jgi:hypothetical protein
MNYMALRRNGSQNSLSSLRSSSGPFVENWKSKTENRKLKIENWKTKTENRKLKIENWKTKNNWQHVVIYWLLLLLHDFSPFQFAFCDQLLNLNSICFTMLYTMIFMKIYLCPRQLRSGHLYLILYYYFTHFSSDCF